MLFSRLAGVFQSLEETSSQTQMVQILADIIEEATEDNIDKICYLTLGEIAAGYEDVKIGMAEKMVLSSIAIASGETDDEIEKRLREEGDLGRVASQVIERGQVKLGEKYEIEDSLRVEDVFSGLRRIASAEGKGSQEVKKKTLASMMAKGNQEERKYLARLAAGQMRLGVGDMTLLDSLAVAFLGSKEDRPPLERAYNLCSDIGQVARTLLVEGLKGVQDIDVTVDRPIRPMLAQRVSELSEIGEKIPSESISVEEKYDGERIQAHKRKEEVRLFSRRLSDVTDHFPDIVKYVRNNVGADTAIIDGEAVAYDFENEAYYPFQKLMHRRRKYDIKRYAEEIPVRYVVFDLLYYEGKTYLDEPYPERRSRLEGVVVDNPYMGPSERITTGELDEVEGFFQKSMEKGLEGIICKSTGEDSVYRAGAREWSWIKWKPEYSSELADTFDLVVVGAYSGRGKRGGTYGALLCAAYDHEHDLFQTATKVGAGFTDEDLEDLPDRLADARTERKPARVEAKSEMEPDYWFEPRYVLEVRASEITRSPTHTCGWDDDKQKGLALRFPRFLRWRAEKAPEQATTATEIKQMYKA